MKIHRLKRVRKDWDVFEKFYRKKPSLTELRKVVATTERCLPIERRIKIASDLYRSYVCVVSDTYTWVLEEVQVKEN